MEKLPKYLFYHLLEALRRDMRLEEHKALRTGSYTQASLYHGLNARFDREILQYLRPKDATPEDTSARHHLYSHANEPECLID
jgi:hypothetical protein